MGTFVGSNTLNPENVESNRVVLSAKQKALRINMNHDLYGTFAEIGAGQEVVRHFFRAGGASGTIAKTISAYDKDFSDAIYGVEASGRYVCEAPRAEDARPRIPPL